MLVTRKYLHLLLLHDRTLVILISAVRDCVQSKIVQDHITHRCHPLALNYLIRRALASPRKVNKMACVLPLLLLVGSVSDQEKGSYALCDQAMYGANALWLGSDAVVHMSSIKATATLPHMTRPEQKHLYLTAASMLSINATDILLPKCVKLCSRSK